jgi:hypothetical protein
MTVREITVTGGVGLSITLSVSKGLGNIHFFFDKTCFRKEWEDGMWVKLQFFSSY